MQDSSQHGGSRPGAGRPRREQTLAAALREKFPVTRLVEIAERLLEGESDDVRYRALMAIWDRAHGKVTDRLELSVGGLPAGALSMLPEQRRAMLHQARAGQLALQSGDDADYNAD